MSPFIRRATLCLLALATVASAPAWAQAWPSKTIRLVAVFPPGGSVDQVARILSQQLTKQLGQSVVVENIGGASARSARQPSPRPRPTATPSASCSTRTAPTRA